MPKVKEKKPIGAFKRMAMKEGEDKKAKEIAKNFKDLGVEIVKIEKATGLSKEEIEKL